MQAERSAREAIQTVHCQIVLSIVAASFGELQIPLDVADDFLDKLKRLFLIGTKLSVLLVGQPVVDFILTNDGVFALGITPLNLDL